MRRARRRPLGAVFLAALLVLAACGGNDDDDGGGGAAAPDAGGDSDRQTSVVCEGEPREGGTLTQLTPSYVDNLDVQKQSSFNVQDQAGPVYSRLVAFKAGADVEYGDQVVEPDLATEWEISDDGLTYTFTLRDDVVWHDVPPVNGRKFVASDVVASMNRLKAEGVARYMLETLESVEAPNDTTVVFNLSAPFAPLLNYLASHFMWILPVEATNGGFDPTTTAIGTGPFVMTSRNPNVEITYARNEDYYGEMPKIDGFRRLVVPDQGARIAAFRAGDADIIGGLSPEETASVAASTPGSEVLDLLAAGHIVIYVNQSKAPMSDLDFRKALALAIDKEGMGDAITGGGRYSGPIPPTLGKWALDQDELAEAYPYDPEAAEELLAQAGLQDATIGLVVTPGYGEQVTRAAQWVVQDLADVGINAQIELVDYATYFTNRWPQLQYDIIVGLQTPFTEADEWLRAQHGTGETRNWFGISDPELDEMLQEQLTILDEEERVEFVHDTQRYIIDNVMNPIPLWNYATRTLASDRVCDYYPQELYGFYEYRYIWLEQ